MSKLNKVLSNEYAFMALGYVPMLQMFHVEIIEENSSIVMSRMTFLSIKFLLI